MTQQRSYIGLLHISNAIFLRGKYAYFKQEKRNLSILSIRKAMLEKLVIVCCLPTPWAEQGDMGLNFSKTSLNSPCRSTYMRYHSRLQLLHSLFPGTLLDLSGINTVPSTGSRAQRRCSTHIKWTQRKNRLGRCLLKAKHLVPM